MSHQEISKRLDIEERRKQIRSMLARSKTEQEIADELDKSRRTILRDIKALKEESNQSVYDLAKSDLAFYYMQCLQTIQESERMIWETYRNRKSLKLQERKERYQVAKMIRESAQARMGIFKDGPIMMTVKALENRLSNIEFGKKG
jgi:transcriptional regulator of NAD metabolism